MKVREMLFYDNVFIEGVYLRYWEEYGTGKVFDEKPVWLLTEGKNTIASVTVIPDDLEEFVVHWVKEKPSVKLPLFDRILDAKSFDYELVPKDGGLVAKKRTIKRAGCGAAVLDGVADCSIFGGGKKIFKGLPEKYSYVRYYGPFRGSVFDAEVYYVAYPSKVSDRMYSTEILIYKNGKKYVYRVYPIDNGVFLRTYDGTRGNEYPLLLQNNLMQPVYDHYLRGFLMVDELSKMIYDLYAGKVWAYDEKEKKFVLVDEFVGVGKYFTF